MYKYRINIFEILNRNICEFESKYNSNLYSANPIRQLTININSDNCNAIKNKCTLETYNEHKKSVYLLWHIF